MRSPQQLTTLFREQNKKVTPQRRAVFEALHKDDSHPTAETIWARVRALMPTVSLRTVYQALNDLVELGEIQMVSVGSGAALFDPNEAAHEHFVCRCCERIFDVVASRPVLVSSYPIPAMGKPRLSDVAAGNYTVETSEIVFRGLCAGCADSTKTVRAKTPPSPLKHADDSNTTLPQKEGAK